MKESKGSHTRKAIIRVVGKNSISILPFDPSNHNKSFMWLTKDSSTVLRGQMNNFAMENSNTNAGDLLKVVRIGMKTNGDTMRGKCGKGKVRKSVNQYQRQASSA